MTSVYKGAVELAVGLYRRSFGLVFPTACKHYPSCSEYCLQAVDKHGVMRGCYLAMRRFLRCHPFSRGGYDPVPPRRG